MRTAAAVALVVLLLAGCGGGARRIATAAREAAQPTETQLLQRYFAAMAPHERRFDELSQQTIGAIQGVDVARPDASWGQASRALAPVETGFDELGVAISRVDAPGPLADAHQRLAEATLSFGEFVSGLRQALASRLPELLTAAATADTSTIKAARSAWATVVKRYAAKLGVLPPDWLVPSPAA